MGREQPWRYGTVVELSARGYGFLVADDGKQRAFFHFNVVETPEHGRKGNHRLDGLLKIGERVRWQAGKDAGKGPRARAVKLLTAEEKLVVGEEAQ